FVTSVDRPFTESERAFMAHIRAWGKKVVLVLNKIDLLAGEAELAQVQAFVRESVERLLGFSPTVFPVAARLAAQAKPAPPPPAQAGQETQATQATQDAQDAQDAWQRSRF